MARSDELRRVVAAARDLHEELGTLSTLEQIAEASHYVSMIRNTKDDDFKEKIWRRYVKEYCNHGWVWDQISIYRHTAQSSHFFAPGEELDYLILNELTCALELWCSLIMAGKLQRLLQHEDYQGVIALQESGASPAEVYRAYINVHKGRAGIDKWTKMAMCDMRFTIYEMVQEVRREGDHARLAVSIKQEIPRPGFPNNTQNREDTHSLYGASPRPVARSNAHPPFPEAQPAQSAPQSIPSTSPSSEIQGRSQTQNSPINDPQVNDEPSRFQRLFAKVRKFETDLKAMEVKVTEKQMAVQEIEEAAEKAKTRFRNVDREAQLADLDSLEPEDWTPADFLRQEDKIQKVAKLKREALRAVSDLLEKKKASKIELVEVETEARKYRDRMQRLMDLAQELDEN